MVPGPSAGNVLCRQIPQLASCRGFSVHPGQDAGDISVDDPELAAEQFAAMCKGMGDLERRFGMARDEQRDTERIDGAVDVFCRAYAIGDSCSK